MGKLADDFKSSIYLHHIKNRLYLRRKLRNSTDTCCTALGRLVTGKILKKIRGNFSFEIVWNLGISSVWKIHWCSFLLLHNLYCCGIILPLSFKEEEREGYQFLGHLQVFLLWMFSSFSGTFRIRLESHNALCYECMLLLKSLTRVNVPLCTSSVSTPTKSRWL